VYDYPFSSLYSRKVEPENTQNTSAALGDAFGFLSVPTDRRVSPALEPRLKRDSFPDPTISPQDVQRRSVGEMRMLSAESPPTGVFVCSLCPCRPFATNEGLK
jgi:hypothetical protein